MDLGLVFGKDGYTHYFRDFQVDELEAGDLCLFTVEDSRIRYEPVLNVLGNDEVRPHKNDNLTPSGLSPMVGLPLE